MLVSIITHCNNFPGRMFFLVVQNEAHKLANKEVY